MSESTDLLADLRDIIEPAAPASAPPWLMLANLGLAILLVLLLAYRWRKRRRAWLDEAIRRLRVARTAEPETALLDMARLLRQIVRQRNVDRSIQALHGEAWLEHLDAEFDTDWFTRGDGRLFGDDLYRSAAARESQPALTASLTAALADELRRRLGRLPMVTRAERVERATRADV